MKAAIKFFLYMGLIMIILYTSGCFYNNDAGSGKMKEEIITLEQPDCAPTNEATLPVIADTTEKTKVVLYFADDNGNLVAERREIPKVVGIARRTMQELCRGPQNSAISPTLPAGTELLDINIRDGLCTVNFSKQLITAHSGGSAMENQTVYSIVNTLTQFRTVERVQIQVDGRIVDSIAGHIDVSVPLARNSDIINSL
ncbi:GerMN domain-containing protein [Desulfoscipio geothermicus]|uniref:Sporulation and spore germination n=1 Tax=Desulfoscipio geothermicus DSM 3669 TaxID=1121426 RepID=A0A1I6E4Z8_9FIRM|nr:GerMN domain-containing protein [Desulfoscipio geothermicus]SFR12805.1 Sporulation and spore germination [Desulfoscipio geothermicus DSM 3669]